MPTEQDIARQLVREEIERLVTDAEAQKATLRTGGNACRLFAAYSGANWSVGRIIDEMVAAASKRGVAVEIDRGM
jgi:hypothetical protein